MVRIKRRNPWITQTPHHFKQRDPQKTDAPHLAVRLMIWFLPMLALWLWWRIYKHYYFTMISVLFFVVFPGLLVTRIIFLLRSDKDGVVKGWLTALCVIAGAVILFFAQLLPVRTYTQTRKDAQDKFQAAARGPLVEEALQPLELGLPKSVKYHDYRYSFLFWDDGAKVLQCSYSPEEYEKAKESVLSRYAFRTEPIPELGITNSGTGEPVTKTIGTDVFFVLFPQDGTDYESVLPTVTVALNDGRHEIFYVVGFPGSVFLEDDRHWSFIRYGIIRYLPEVFIW